MSHWLEKFAWAFAWAVTWISIFWRVLQYSPSNLFSANHEDLKIFLSIEKRAEDLLEVDFEEIFEFVRVSILLLILSMG